MKKTLLFFLTAFVALAMHAPANAMFYRVVAEGPDHIFSQGFQPWGNNPSLFEHVVGTSCNRANREQFLRDGTGSRYISLTATMDAAMRVARRRLDQTVRVAGQPEPVVWVYEVRPTATTYNAPLTFERAGVDLTAGRMRVPYQNALYLDEWIEDGAIATERIREARQYRLVNGVAVEVPGMAVTNARYVNAQTAANAAPLPPSTVTGQATPAQRARAVIGTAAAGLMSACWCDTASRDLVKRSVVADPVDACLASIQTLNDVVPSVRYFPTNGWEVTIN
jgi:hypothetical protein